MNIRIENQIIELTEQLIDCFLESFDIGELADSAFSKEYNKPQSFSAMKKFHNANLKCLSANPISSSQLAVRVVDTILNKVDNYFKSDPKRLLSKFDEFDQSVSKSYFSRTIANIPQNSPYFDIIYNWCFYVWSCIYDRISSYESMGNYTHILYTGLKQKIDIATNQVSALENKVGKEGKEQSTGLFKTMYMLESKINESEKSIENLRNGIYNSTVSVLGIFASIVLTFAGVFSFSSSVLENINAISIYRLIGIISLVGIVAFNLIICLILYLLRGSKIPKKIFSAWKFYSPIWIVDLILIASLLFSFWAWKNDWLTKEKPSGVTYSSQETASVYDNSCELDLGTSTANNKE